MRKRTIVAVVAAFVMGGALGASAMLAFGPAHFVGSAGTSPAHPVWTEAAWPFPVDEWGKGKAFRCAAADCGAEVNLYIRAKIGFCNCTTGVSDDDELDRLSDFNLMGGKPSVLGSGRPIDVAWMKGRVRSYALNAPARTGGAALAIAFNNRCDAVVATAIVAHDRPAAIEPGVLEFLNGKTIVRWTEITLGL